jgi:MATE family multidrug resistance protein
MISMPALEKSSKRPPLGSPATVVQETRAVLTIAVPLAVAYLGEMAMVITDRIIVGRLGAVELAAVGLAGDLMFEVMVVAMGVVSVVGVLVARCIGAGEEHRIRAQVRQGLWVAAILSVPITVFCWNITELLSLTDQDPKVMELGKIYLTAAVWCLLPTLWFTVLRQFLAALERMKSILYITTAMVFLNAGLTYSLVFGVFGMPRFGVAGAGIATSIVCWVMFFSLMFHLTRAKGLREYALLTNIWRVDFAVVREIFALGLPVGGITLVESGLFAIVAIMMGLFGATALAAGQVVTGMVIPYFVIALSIGEATALRVSCYAGGGRPRSARRTGFVGIGIGIVIMTAGAVMLLAIPERLTGIFIDVADPKNAEVVTLAGSLFAIAAVFQLSDGLQAIVARALRGLKDTMIPMWIAALGYWGFGLSGGYLIGFPLGYGAAGLWWGIAIGLTVTAILLTWRFVIISSRETG